MSLVLYVSLKRQEPTRLSQSQSPSPLCADINEGLIDSLFSFTTISTRQQTAPLHLASIYSYLFFFGLPNILSSNEKRASSGSTRTVGT
jgi:hypothetical protein